jgi:glutamyl-tRNA synthetase
MKYMILKHVLINAVGHSGKARVGAVLGSMIAENPGFKTKIKELTPQIKKVVDEVNSWGLKKQKAKMKKLRIKIEKKKGWVGLPALPKAKKGKVVMRIAPYPSGPLHIGNARMVILNDEYVKTYNGKLILVFDDTIGSKKKFIIPEAYNLIQEGLKWLGVKTAKPIYKSDRLKIFYKYAKQMIEKDLAYVCTCPADTLRKNRREGVECDCRKMKPKENLKRWKGMLNGKYKEGEAILRLKTDMKHPNPAFRDRVLMRIADRKHPRTGKKYKVWPMLEFSWAIDDHELGITHVLRGKDLTIEDMMENYIWEKMGWKKAEFVHYGLLNIKDVKLSKTKSRIAIEEGNYSGWEDPRTWSMQSLRKRGIMPEAIRKFIVSLGVSLADIVIPKEILYAENRKIIDAKANRYFALLDPIKLSVKNAPKIKGVKAPLHPDFPKRGKRKITVNSSKIYVDRTDFEKLYGQNVGLINLYTIKMERSRGKADFFSKEIRMEDRKIQWVSEPNAKIKVIMPDGSAHKGIAEPDIKKVKMGDVIQLVRLGFCHVDKKGKETVLYFAHK